MRRVAMLRAVVLSFTLLIGYCSAAIPLPDLPFLQPIASKMLYAGSSIEGFVQLPFITSVSQLVHGAIGGTTSNNTFIVLADTHLYALDFSSSPPLVSPLDTFNISISSSSHLVSTNGYLIILSNLTSFICALQGGYCKPLPATYGHVTASCVSSSGDIYYGTESGLYGLSMSSFSISPLKQLPSDESISALAWDAARSYLWVGTKGTHHKLHFFDPTDDSPKNWQYYYAHYVATHHVRSLAFDQEGNLWVADNGSLSIVAPDWSITWLSGDNGVPHLDILRVHTSPSGAIWAGTMYGVWRYYEGHWKYFYGPRWIPDMAAAGVESISQMAFGSSSDPSGEFALLASTYGLSAISFQQWTLESKAMFYQSLSHLHFQHLLPWNDSSPPYPDPMWYGALYLAQYGNESTAILGQASNDPEDDGIWSSMQLVAQAMRYAVTNDTDAWSQAWAFFLGLEFLHNVTGIPGLVARAAQSAPAPPSSTWRFNPWYNSTVFPDLVWQGGTSSDQLTGHMLAYAVMHDLVAHTEEERARVVAPILSIMHYLVDNGLLYIDANGNYTHWGTFSPHFINEEPFYWDERGIYSAMLMTWLSMAYRYSGNETFLEVLDWVVDEHGYAFNAVNARMFWPEDLNASDDELFFLIYLAYAWAHTSGNYSLSRPVIDAAMQLSAARTWSGVQSESLSLWNFVYAYFQQQFNASASNSGTLSDAISASLWQLGTFPLDLLDWPVNNTLRVDVSTNPLVPDCIASAVDYDELPIPAEWNGNPLSITGGSGVQLGTPTLYLLPYWLGRYAGYIQAPANL